MNTPNIGSCLRFEIPQLLQNRLKFILILLTFLYSVNLFSQNKNELKFEFIYQDSTLVLGKEYSVNSKQDSIRFDKIKFYISNLCLYTKDGGADTLKELFFLVDIKNLHSTLIKSSTINFNDYNSISFDVGIDSITNMMGAFGGVLDPIHGMYWAWQSGYINFKLEGTHSSCSTRNNEFLFHIGGYQYPFNMIQNVKIELSDSFVIQIFIEKLMDKIDTLGHCEIMSPNQNGLFIAQSFQDIFKSKK